MRYIFLLSVSASVTFIAFAFMALAQTHSNGSNSTCQIDLTGPTDQAMHESVAVTSCTEPTFQISSVGGNGAVALAIAYRLKSLQTEVRIKEICFSSCAEFLLAGAAKLTFESEPLIGFHGNPPMKEWLAGHFEVPNIEYCEFQESDHMYDLYFERDMNFGFWRQQLDVLTLQAFAVDPEIAPESCPKMGFDFEHEMWFPSSATLRDDLGLNFTGSVCADDIEACAARVRAMFPNRGTFVIDDRVIDTRVAM